MSDFHRILNLPILGSVDTEWVEEFSKKNCPPYAFDDRFRGLNAEQALALETFRHYGRAFVMSGVGTGKTLVAYGCAMIAHNERQHERILIIVPNNVAQQFLTQGRREAADWLGFDMPVHTTFKKPIGQRRTMAKLGRPGVYVIPYSHLALKDSYDLLTGIGATCIIADEAHRLKNTRAASTKRLFAAMREAPRAEIVLLSGTMTRRGLRDYWHLANVCLREFSPVPRELQAMREWGTVLDASGSSFDALGGEGLWGADPATRRRLFEFVEWCRENFPDEDLGEEDETRVRRAYQKRLRSTVGVIASPPGELPCPLVIDNVPVGVPSPEILDLMYGVQHLGITPSGDEIEYGLHRYKWMLELSAGFYHDLRWPTVEDIVSKRHCTVAQATEWLERSHDHHELKQQYNKDLRRFLDYRSEPGLDTPMLIGNEFRLNRDQNLPPELFRRWMAVREADFDDIVERFSVPVRVSPYKIDALVKWAKTHHKTGQGALIWVHHNEMRRWTVERLLAAGLPAIDCPSGSKEAHRALAVETADPTAFQVLSHEGFREGLNCQWNSTAVFLQWPRGDDVAEQAIGRQHRQGQEADECNVFTVLSDPIQYQDEMIDFDRMLFAATLVDALYVQQTTGASRRLMAAGYTSPPVIYPPAMLAERIPDVAYLTQQQAAELFQRFSG